MKIRKDVAKMVLPILAEQGFIMAMGVVNTKMASNLGNEAISAVGNIDAINNIVISFFSALAVGGTVVVAQSIGRRDYNQARKAGLNGLVSGLGVALIVTLILAIFRNLIVHSIFGTAEAIVMKNTLIYFGITIIGYPMIAMTSISFGILRGAGDTKTPMRISIFMNVLNVVLSYLFIYGISISNTHFHMVINGMGIRGAAIGITIARTIGMAMALHIFFTKFLELNIREMKNFHFSKDLLKDIFNIGLPSGLESLVFNGGKLITQVFIVGMGTVSIASNAIASSIFGLLNIPGIALSIAATAMVGQAIGRNDVAGAKSTLKYITQVGIGCLIVLCALLFPFANHVVSIFTDDPAVISKASGLLRSATIVMPLSWATSFVLPAGLKGGRDVKYTLMVSVIGMWAFRIGIGYVLAIPLGLGLIGIWLSMYIDWIVRSILFVLRFRGDKWFVHTK